MRAAARKVLEAEQAAREDGLDRLSGAGVPSANAKGRGRYRLNQHDIDDLYTSSGTAARIVDCVAEEATRAGFTVETDETFDQIAFKSWWEGIDADSVITQAIIYARQYGGAAIHMLSKTEGDETQPWRDGEQIDSLRAVACVELSPRDEMNFDPNELGMPEVWNVQPIFGGNDVPVHNSRLLKIFGKPQPVSWRKSGSGSERYFGMSVFQGIVEEIMDYDDCHAWASLLLKRLQQGVWYGDGIADACETKAGERSVHRRLALVDGIRSAKSTIAVDKENEDYKLLNGNLTGVKDLLTAKASRLTQATGIPAIILSGDTSGGLNNSAEGALSGWEDTISRLQTFQLTGVVQRLIQTEYKTLSKYKIDWNPLAQETAQQRADRIAKEAEADNKYMTGYILTVDEIRDTLEKRGDYVLGAKPPELPKPTVVTPEDANPEPTPAGNNE